jgi:hypothetical protein
MNRLAFPQSVIPAKAGIQGVSKREILDASFRWHDGGKA